MLLVLLVHRAGQGLREQREQTAQQERVAVPTGVMVVLAVGLETVARGAQEEMELLVAQEETELLVVLVVQVGLLFLLLSQSPLTI